MTTPTSIRLAPHERSGSAAAPASKSHAHRLLLCAALSDGVQSVEFGSLSGDLSATLRCLQALGADVTVEGGRAVFQSSLHNVVYHNRILLPCGESGSTLRFLLPLCGALGVEAEFMMEGRLGERPLAPLYELLRAKGMELWRSGSSLFCRGKLQSGEYSITGSVSSQFITGLLYALPLLEGESTLRVTGKVESAPYIAMTEDALFQSGIRFEKEGWVYSIPGSQRYALPKEAIVEGDWSNAAFLLSLGAFSEKGVRVENLPAHSLQGDRAILSCLRSFGAMVEEQGSAVTVRKGTLRGITIDASQIPDLVPVLAVLASGAEGCTEILHAERVRTKESDRLHTTALLLRSLGADIEELPDGLRIFGVPSLRGGEAESFHDHRIAMAAAVAASLCRESVTVHDALCVEKSYPAFWEVFDSLEVKA